MAMRSKNSKIGVKPLATIERLSDSLVGGRTRNHVGRHAGPRPEGNAITGPVGLVRAAEYAMMTDYPPGLRGVMDSEMRLLAGK